MKKCKTCEYWYPGETENGFQRGNCACPKISGGTYSEHSEDLEKDGMLISAYDDFIAVETGEDFFCCHWKEKDDADTP